MTALIICLEQAVLANQVGGFSVTDDHMTQQGLRDCRGSLLCLLCLLRFFVCFVSLLSVMAAPVSGVEPNKFLINTKFLTPLQLTASHQIV